MQGRERAHARALRRREPSELANRAAAAAEERADERRGADAPVRRDEITREDDLGLGAVENRPHGRERQARAARGRGDRGRLHLDRDRAARAPYRALRRRGVEDRPAAVDRARSRAEPGTFGGAPQSQRPVLVDRGRRRALAADLARHHHVAGPKLGIEPAAAARRNDGCRPDPLDSPGGASAARPRPMPETSTATGEPASDTASVSRRPALRFGANRPQRSERGAGLPGERGDDQQSCSVDGLARTMNSQQS